MRLIIHLLRLILILLHIWILLLLFLIIILWNISLILNWWLLFLILNNILLLIIMLDLLQILHRDLWYIEIRILFNFFKLFHTNKLFLQNSVDIFDNHYFFLFIFLFLIVWYLVFKSVILFFSSLWFLFLFELCLLLVITKLHFMSFDILFIKKIWSIAPFFLH